MKKNLKNQRFNDVENIQNKVSSKEAIGSLLALLESLSYEVSSSDVWFLAMSSAKEIATKQYDVSEASFITMMEKFEKVRKNKNKQNPMSSMF